MTEDKQSVSPQVVVAVEMNVSLSSKKHISCADMTETKQS